MRQNDIVIGGTYCVKIGSRLATVTVNRQRQRHEFGRTRTVFVCTTHDTRREIEATAARLRPVPGTVGAENEAARKAAAAEAARLERERRADAAAARATATSREILAQAAAASGWESGAALGDHLDQWLARLPGNGAAIDAREAVLRALATDPRLPAEWSWPEIAAIGRLASAGGPFSRPAGHPAAGLLAVNRERLVELPLGANLACLRNLVGRCHVAEPLLSVARRVCRSIGPWGTRRMPVPMRRGLWQTAARMHAENRDEYRAVMGHDPLPSPALIADAVGRAVGLGPMPRG